MPFARAGVIEACIFTRQFLVSRYTLITVQDVHSAIAHNTFYPVQIVDATLFMDFD